MGLIKRIRDRLNERDKELQARKDKRQKEHFKRLEELIKTASTNEPKELAEYLINNGVCDSIEVKRIKRKAYNKGYANGYVIGEEN